MNNTHGTYHAPLNYEGPHGPGTAGWGNMWGGPKNNIQVCPTRPMPFQYFILIFELLYPLLNYTIVNIRSMALMERRSGT